MKTKSLLISVLVLLSTVSFGQIKFGLTAGLNLANESSDFSGASLGSLDKQGSITGLLAGPTLEAMIPIVGIGAEVSALYSRKGSNFKYDLVNPDPMNAYDLTLEGKKTMDCIDIPLNLKYKIGLPKIAKIYFVAGWYWSFAFNGKVAVDAAVDNSSGSEVASLEKEDKMDFKDAYQSVDNGLNFGAGAEILEKVQLGVYYSISLKNTSSEQAVSDMLDGSYSFNPGDFDLSSKSRVLSIRLTYLF